MTLALSLALADLHLFRYDLREGVELRFTVTREYVGPAEGESLLMAEEATVRVGSSEDGRLWPVEIAGRPVRYAMDGEDLPVPEADEATLSRHIRDARGQVRDRIAYVEDRPSRERVDRALDLVFLADPVRVGQTWERNVAFDPETRFPGARWRWTLRGVEAGTATISLEFGETEGETPIWGEGTWAIDQATGWARAIDAELQNVPIPGDEESARATLRVTVRRR